MSRYYEKIWVDAMQRLDNIVQEEESDGANDAMIYQLYLDIYSDLNTVYINLDNAQKRRAIGETITLMTIKIICLRNQIDSYQIRDQVLCPSGKRNPVTLIPAFFKKNNNNHDSNNNYSKLHLSSRKISSKRNYAHSMETITKGVPLARNIIEIVPNENKIRSEMIICSLLDDDFTVSEIECRAVLIQRYVRGFLTRSKLDSEKRWLHQFIGIDSFNTDSDSVESSKLLFEYSLSLQKNQYKNEISYQDALQDIKDEIRQEEGLQMRERIREERVEWATNIIATTSDIPDIMDFYESKEGEKRCNQTKLKVNIKNFKESWIPCIHSTALYSKQLAKDLLLRNEVYEELRLSEDEKMSRNFDRIKSSSGQSSKKMKSSRDGEKRSTTKASKKTKGLPGDMIEDLKHLTSKEMHDILTSFNMVNLPKEESLSDIISCPDDYVDMTSSLSDMKRLLTEYCILPNISNEIKDNLEDEHMIRSILLYGTKGCGKSTAVHAVAGELRAMVIEISPDNIPMSLLDQPDGSTQLIHMVFTVAKDPEYQPVIILLNDCDNFFKPLKKNSSESLSSKFQKNLLMYKNQSITRDRVILIGCTSSPSDIDPKILRWKGSSGKPEKQGFFERIIHVPTPGFMERALIWERFVNRTLNRHGMATNSVHVDFNLLSSRSEGYSAGIIIKCINTVFSTAETIIRLIESSDKLKIEVQLLLELEKDSSFLSCLDSFAKFQESISFQKPTQDNVSNKKEKANKK